MRPRSLAIVAVSLAAAWGVGWALAELGPTVQPEPVRPIVVVAEEDSSQPGPDGEGQGSPDRQAGGESSGPEPSGASSGPEPSGAASGPGQGSVAGTGGSGPSAGGGAELAPVPLPPPAGDDDDRDVGDDDDRGGD